MGVWNHLVRAGKSCFPLEKEFHHVHHYAPKVVQNTIDEFREPLFKKHPQRKHLANYLTGSMIAENKTIVGMNHDMPNASDQSCLNPYFGKYHFGKHRSPKSSGTKMPSTTLASKRSCFVSDRVRFRFNKYFRSISCLSNACF